jgi:hypothetical protein
MPYDLYGIGDLSITGRKRVMPLPVTQTKGSVMKGFRFLFAVLSASLLAVSCAKHIDQPDAGHGPVRFAATAEWGQTRGMPILSATDIPDMGVFAYYTGNGVANNWAAQGAAAAPNFMNNVQVTNSAGTWSYANTVYWPTAADANVTFFAYSPYAGVTNGISASATTGIPSISYTVPTNCSDQPDLMVSALVTDRNQSNNGAAPVTFQMKHALACIGFKATGNGEEITLIKVTGVKTSGILTVAADGTPTWDISAAASGDFEATVDGGVALDPSSQLINSGGGYLMMIPQTLPAGAKLVIGVNDGRSDVEFDLGGLTWAAGQRINYSLEITPDAILLLTPDKIILPNPGGFSQFNVIEENGSSSNWTLSVGSPFLICDNLTDLQAWAAGTLPNANVRNLNGSAPVAGGSYSGSGSKTLYVWKFTANPSNTATIDGTIAQVGNAAALINVSQLPNVDPSSVTNTVIANSYVGAFWTASRTGERIIRIPVTASTNEGAWDASVLWTDGSWKAGDIVFSTQQSADGGITYVNTTQTPADMLNAVNDDTYKVAGYVSSASGNVAAGDGNYIYFRIGLTSAYTPTASFPARYAVVLLRYGTPGKNHLIFLRQGEEADYMARGTGAPKWAVYNVGSPAGTFMSYPSQAGWFKRWTTATTMYAPIGTVSWNTESTSSIANVCPAGYQIPNSDGTSTYSASNQLYSLIAAGENKSVSGYYADGYFDRRAIVPSSSGTLGSTVMPSTANVAYTGLLYYNTTTYASVFLSKAGSRNSIAGTLNNSGTTGSYWSSSLSGTTAGPYLLQIMPSTSLIVSTSELNVGYSVRCVKP